MNRLIHLIISIIFLSLVFMQIQDKNILYFHKNDSRAFVEEIFIDFSLIETEISSKNSIYLLIENEELKILQIINGLDKKAREKDGRVIKLIGNHELLNLNSNHEKQGGLISQI